MVAIAHWITDTIPRYRESCCLSQSRAISLSLFTMSDRICRQRRLLDQRPVQPSQERVMSRVLPSLPWEMPRAQPRRPLVASTSPTPSSRWVAVKH